uniref:Uncharacterized protein n=1 Tax=Kalanchoe fedtschenkoi TaxID=63787 RepID=A0A7N0UUW9_KALFE
MCSQDAQCSATKDFTSHRRQSTMALEATHLSSRSSTRRVAVSRRSSHIPTPPIAHSASRLRLNPSSPLTPNPPPLTLNPPSPSTSSSVRQSLRQSVINSNRKSAIFINRSTNRLFYHTFSW